MVKFLLDTSAALIKSIPGQVHDAEGVHDRPRAGEFFSGGALEAGEAIGPVRKLLTVCLCGCCPGRLV